MTRSNAKEVRYAEQQSSHLFYNVGVLFCSIVLLCLTLKLSSFIKLSGLNLAVNTILLDTIVVFVMTRLRIQEKITQRMIVGTIVLLDGYILINYLLASGVIFHDFINGMSGSVSNHYEHSLMFYELRTIAERLSMGYSLANATAGLPLNQYYSIFVYTSMLFFFGGVNVLNIIIWNGFHLFLCAILLMLILDEYWLNLSIDVKTGFFLALAQPLFIALFMYNKVIIGEAIILLAMYIYISTIDSSLHGMLAFPVYAYLFWVVRLQYVVIAVLMLFIMLSRNGVSLRTIVPIIIVLIGAGVFIISSNITVLFQEKLNYSYYMDSNDLSVTSIPARIIRSFLPYFPATNVLTDDYWYFNIFCVLQEAMNITLWYLVLLGGLRLSLRRIIEKLKNPMVMIAVVFLLSGTLSELHTTYLSVGSMLLIGGLDDVSGKRLRLVFGVTLVLVIMLSLIYDLLGITGAGFMNVSFGR